MSVADVEQALAINQRYYWKDNALSQDTSGFMSAEALANIHYIEIIKRRKVYEIIIGFTESCNACWLYRLHHYRKRYTM
jgi:hypothetical protein